MNSIDSIPKYDQLMKPILILLEEQGKMRLREVQKPLAELMKLPEEVLEIELESGNGKVFFDRVGWALSYLAMVKLLHRPAKGVYEITDLGRSKLTKDADALATEVKKAVQQRQKSKPKNEEKAENQVKAAEMVSDVLEEKLKNLHEVYIDAISEELLEKVLSMNPFDFERLVVDVLKAMGYGGKLDQSDAVTQKSGDGGVDAVIFEDKLGLGRIHVQAKRYARDRTIGRPDIQAFVGALMGFQSSKGVFITTSRFSPDARKYVEEINCNVALIDGKQLMRSMYECGVGVQDVALLKVKSVDKDFWF